MLQAEGGWARAAPCPSWLNHALSSKAPHSKRHSLTKHSIATRLFVKKKQPPNEPRVNVFYTYWAAAFTMLCFIKNKKTFLSLSAWAAHVLFPDPGIPLTTTQAAELAPEGSFVSLDWMQGWMNWSTKARSPKRPGAPYLSKRLHSFCPTSGDTFCKRG